MTIQNQAHSASGSVKYRLCQCGVAHAVRREDDGQQPARPGRADSAMNPSVVLCTTVMKGPYLDK